MGALKSTSVPFRVLSCFEDMLDIEDSVGRLSPVGKTDADRFFNVRIVKRRRKATDENDNKLDEQANDELSVEQLTRSVLPWDAVVFLRTWGCSHNNSDSEYMAGLLARAGYRLTADKNAANIWLLNSCTVKTPSETQLENQVREAKAQLKKVIVAGCVSQASPNEPWLKDVSIVGVQQIDQIVPVVEETLKGNSIRLLSKRKGANEVDLSLPKIRRNEFIEILAINSGCLNHCTYCKTKAARGDLRSLSLDSLVAQAKRALTEEGCRELWLTSEDLGAWGRDIGHTIPDLLRALVQVIPEGCMMRLGMTNPPYILDHLEEIAQILRHPRVYAFLHIPVQSGSNAVLSDMKREYTREHFSRIVDFMLANVPDVYIATDLICAFPTETEADFEESVDLVRRYQFPSLFINQFYPRPGTPAARLKKINTVEARRRTAAMTQLFHSYRRYTEARIGEQHTVLVCERASDQQHFVGHNKSYEHILVPANEEAAILGRWVRVRIVGVSKFFMRAEIVDDGVETCAVGGAERGAIDNSEEQQGQQRQNGNGAPNGQQQQHLAAQLALIRWTVAVLVVALLLKLLSTHLLMSSS